MLAATINMAPTIEMATFVRRPANSSVTPTLSAIGNTVGAGSTTEGMVGFGIVCDAMGVLLRLNAR